MKNIFGIALIFLGAVGLVFCLIGFLDPKASKLADDSDPFGTPLTIWESAKITVFYFFIFLAGLFLRRKKGV